VKHSVRPPRYNGAVAFYKLSDLVPATHKKLITSKLLTFEDTQLSQTPYIALYWRMKGVWGCLHDSVGP
jgi:hypothetical protein